MSTVPKRSYTKVLLLFISLVMLVSVLAVSIAVFTDRVNKTTTVQIAKFDGRGYTIERTAPTGYFVAGETVDIQLEERNTKDSDLSSQITITGTWTSPVAEQYPWNNDSSSENAVITYETANQSEKISYKVNADNTITFVLPSQLIQSGDTLESTLKITLPNKLTTTGNLAFHFDSIKLRKNAWSIQFDKEQLAKLIFNFDAAWNISKAQIDALGKTNKDVIAVLTEPKSSVNSGYGLHIIKNGQEFNTNGGRMMDWSAAGASPWTNLDITSLSIDEDITTIGNYAFVGEQGITKVTLPNTIEQIGISAFDGAGLTGEIIIPASVSFIGNFAFRGLPMVDTISFKHTSNTLTLPNNNTEEGKTMGAFYVDRYTKTEINSSVQEIIYEYNWVNDNRMAIPMLAKRGTWYTQSGTNIPQSSISSIEMKIKDAPKSYAEKWDASDSSVPGSVWAYLVDDGAGTNTYKLEIIGNGYPVIQANKDSYQAFCNFSAAKEIKGISVLDTAKTTAFAEMFYNCSSLKILDISHFDTAKGTSLSSMFWNCQSLTDLNISTKKVEMNGRTYDSWDTENAKSLKFMFYNCALLETLDLRHFDTADITDFYGAFNNCKTLTDLNITTKNMELNGRTFDSWDTGNATGMEYMFAYCNSLKSLDISHFDTSKTNSMSYMFNSCKALTDLNISTKKVEMNGRIFDSWDTGSVKSTSTMFFLCYKIKTLDVSHFDTKSITSFNSMFSNCKALTDLNISTKKVEMNGRTFDSWDTGKVTNMNNMFSVCESLKAVDVSTFNTTNVTDMKGMFSNCKSISRLDLSSFDTSTVKPGYLDIIARNCSNLIEIVLNNNFGQDNNIPSTGYDHGLFYVDNYTANNPLRTEVTGANDAMMAYDWTTDHRGYTISVEDVEGGTLSTDLSVAINGKEVNLTPVADGTEYDGATISYTEDGTAKTVELDKETTKFTMPAGDVTITPKWWKCRVVVTYDANGGFFDSGTTNVVEYMRGYESVTKTSKTDNVSADGLTADTSTGYGDNLIVTDVVTIPGAESLEVTITYQTHNTEYDWVAIYDRTVTPYATNPEKSISGKLGGTTKTTETFIVPGDTAKFFFKSNRKENNYFGYYAEVTATYKNAVVVSGEEKEAAHDLSYMVFSGWYTDKDCTDGNEFDVTKVSSDITVYAKWEENIPILAPQETWYTQGGTSIAKSKIASIVMVDEVDAATEVAAGTNVWDASDGMKGSVSAYAVPNGDGTYALTIAGNGYGKVFANKNSSSAFADFTLTSTIEGLGLLDTQNTESMGSMFRNCYAVKKLDVSHFDTSKTTGMSQMFNTCSSLVELNINTKKVETNGRTFDSWDTGNVTHMIEMFNGCAKLTDLDVSHFDTSNVVNMAQMFSNSGFTALNINTKSEELNGRTFDSWDTGNVTDMQRMFDNCVNLTDLDVSHFDTSNVTSIYRMFFNAMALNTLNINTKSVELNGRTFDSWDTGNVTDMSYAFGQLYTLTELDISHFDTSKNTTFLWTFANNDALETLKIGTKSIKLNGRTFDSWDTGNVTTMASMFSGCKALQEPDISHFDTSKTTDMHSMFIQCRSFEKLNFATKKVTMNDRTFDSWDTSNVTDMSSMFNSCLKLSSLNICSFDTSSVTAGGLEGFAYLCESLKDIKFGPNVGQANNITLPSGQSTYSMFYSGWNFRTNPLRTKVSGANDVMMGYDWAADYRGYTITVEDVEGSTLTTDLSVAINGKEINLTPVAGGTEYDGATISYTEDGTAKTVELDKETTKFTMPAGDVTITPKWKKAIPMLAKLDTWFTNGNSIHGLAKTMISSIEFSDSIAPGSYAFTWDASDSTVPGTVTAYAVEDGSNYKIYLVGNGYGKIFANTNSNSAFYNFSSTSTISNLSLLDTSMVTSMSAMFQKCKELTNLDVSGFDTSKVTNMSDMFNSCINLTSVDVSGFDTSKVTNMAYMFSECNVLTSLDVSGFDTSKVTNMNAMFQTCMKLTSLDVSGFNTSLVTNMERMFYICKGPTSLDVSGFDTSKVTNMAYMFGGCRGLTNLDVSGFDTSKVTNMSYMFISCTNLTSLDVSGFDTSKVTNMSNMFQACSKLTSLDVSGFNTSLVTNMSGMFSSCEKVTELDVSGFNTSKVTNMSNVFYYCQALTSVDVSGFDTSLVTNMNSMFYSCRNLKSLDVSGFNTSLVTNMNSMFRDCFVLTSLDLSSFDTSLVTNMNRMFNRCLNLLTIYASDLWSTSSVSYRDEMFTDCNMLSGDIAYNSSKTDATYATTSGGYLTYKAAPAAASFSLDYAENGSTDNITITGSDQIN